MRRSNKFGIQFVIRLSKLQETDPATVFARISVNGRRKNEIVKNYNAYHFPCISKPLGLCTMSITWHQTT
ncbi:hypothetical protein QE417_002825 [Mucilaginibacter terrae]|uniref:Arm DNA-binding domain-containing protein n=1 Tax=Mucilaginibacter terrae TaxID=1955052 RepID=A0ABU3GVE8_9SPHI|nr:hypothetical protein [Mucilaginibacter terrae]MDT3403753.1 hypothetical protein [Mucilaginibacter terrae]